MPFEQDNKFKFVYPNISTSKFFTTEFTPLPIYQEKAQDNIFKKW